MRTAILLRFLLQRLSGQMLVQGNPRVGVLLGFFSGICVSIETKIPASIIVFQISLAFELSSCAHISRQGTRGLPSENGHKGHAGYPTPS